MEAQQQGERRHRQDDAAAVAEGVVLLLQGDRGVPRRGHDGDSAPAERREEARGFARAQELAEVSAGAVALEDGGGRGERGRGRGFVVIVESVVVVEATAAAAVVARRRPPPPPRSDAPRPLPVPGPGRERRLRLRDLGREPPDLLGERIGLVDDAKVVRGDPRREGAAEYFFSKREREKIFLFLCIYK